MPPMSATAPPGRTPGSLRVLSQYPAVKSTRNVLHRPARFSGRGDRFTHGTGPWSLSGRPLPLSLWALIAPAMCIATLTFYIWGALQPHRPIPMRDTYPAAFNDEPSVAGPYYHLHPVPTVPVWSWSNRLSDVYDDFFRLTLHCDPVGSCHVEVESFRIR